MSYKKEYQESISDPVSYWQEQAKAIDWFTFPQTILSQDEEGLYRWFKGGKLNTSYLALDHHVKNGRGAQSALIYDSPITQSKKTYSYQELLDEVALFAGVLKGLGVKKGDRVIIYMSMIPEVVFAMLACARLGAVHSVVFGGFAAQELAIRIDDAKPKLVLAASGGIEIKRIIPYKPIIDEALRKSKHQPDACVVFQRDFVKADMQEGRDFDWESLRAKATPADYEIVDATDPLYILYTSGTTGKPKGVVRDNGGHAVALQYSMKNIYGVEPGDTYWAASDVGWVVGHSYIVYAPLIYGCTTVLYEGKPIKTPDASSFWRVINEYQVKLLFTAPTAFRAIKKEDPEGKLKALYDTSCLQYLFLAGERTDVATLEWCENLLRVPVIDHWWQTESGYPMLANMTGLELQPIKPGSAGMPVCGFDIQIMQEDGQVAPPLGEGSVVIRYPLPPGCFPSLWQDSQRFKASYLSDFPGYYLAGDGGYKDEEGYVFITGRIDDVINVAGHRLSTSDMEEIIAAHPAIAECAVIGVYDAYKGQIPVGFYLLKSGIEDSEEQIEKELIQQVRERIGAVASFKRAVKVERLPKTRSGKILRKTMREIADKRPLSPPSTIEDITVLDELKLLMNKENIGKQT
ncbi:MAG: propionyl-CoA synthetase [Bacteroidia bacterium]|nr:propionyl-CoA synthetase [Bacteroidia bacterium]